MLGIGRVFCARRYFVQRGVRLLFRIAEAGGAYAGLRELDTLLGADGAGNMTRLQNVVTALPEKAERFQDSLTQLQKHLENAKQELKQPFLQEQELAEKSQRLTEPDALLNVGNDAPVLEGACDPLETEEHGQSSLQEDELEL